MMSGPQAVPSVVSDETGPGLEQLALAIDQTVNAGNATPSDAGQDKKRPAAIDYAMESESLITVICALILPVYPSLREVYSREVQGKIASALAPLLAKYNLTLGRFAPELGAAAVILPLVPATMDAIKADRIEARKKRAAGAQNTSVSVARGPVPGSRQPVPGEEGAETVTPNAQLDSTIGTQAIPASRLHERA